MGGTGEAAPRTSATWLFFFHCVCADLLLPVSHTRTHYVKWPNLERGAQPKVLENPLLQAFYFITHFQNVEFNLYVTVLIPSYIIVTHYRAEESILIFVGTELKMHSRPTLFAWQQRLHKPDAFAHAGCTAGWAILRAMWEMTCW